jgi:hypothetical protein
LITSKSMLPTGLKKEIGRSGDRGKARCGEI